MGGKLLNVDSNTGFHEVKQFLPSALRKLPAFNGMTSSEAIAKDTAAAAATALKTANRSNFDAQIARKPPDPKAFRAAARQGYRSCISYIDEQVFSSLAYYHYHLFKSHCNIK